MIRIEVEGYCQDCLDFTPEVFKANRVVTPEGEITIGHTTIVCEYRNRCANIKRYLTRQQAKEEESLG
jgi:hypothetical protein